MKNCHECGHAEDLGDKVKCGWTPKKLLALFPFYPACLVSVRVMIIKKEKIPGRDCPAFKPRKQAEKAKGS